MTEEARNRRRRNKKKQLLQHHRRFDGVHVPPIPVVLVLLLLISVFTGFVADAFQSSRSTSSNTRRHYYQDDPPLLLVALNQQDGTRNKPPSSISTRRPLLYLANKRPVPSSSLSQRLPSGSSRSMIRRTATVPAASASSSALFSQQRAADGHFEGSERRRRLLTSTPTAAILRFLFRAMQNVVVRPVTNLFKLKKKKVVRRAAVLLLAPLVFTFGFMMKEEPQVANAAASAPVMALPKAEGRDPASEALLEQERKMVTEAQKELTDMASRAREIERTQGEKARVKYEKQFKEEQTRRAEEKVKGLEDLKRNLLDQGIDPFRDLEGTRQITFYEKGVDLGDVPGTPFYLEKDYETRSNGRNYKKSMAYQKRYNRQVIACMVQDLKNRDIDPLQYFEQRQDQTSQILSMPMAQAQQMAVQYQANIEKYGQITPPKDGELSALEKMKQKADTPQARKALKAKEKEQAKKLKAEAKAKAAAEKAQAKAEKKAAKEAEKASKAAAKKAASAAAAAASASVVPEASDIVDDGISSDEVGGATEGGGGVAVMGADDEAPTTSSSSVATATSTKSDKDNNKLPIIPVSAFLVAAGGGGYALKLYKDKSNREEEERQRQLKLLLGGEDTATKTSNSAGDSSSSGALLLDDQADVKDAPPTTPTSPPVPSPPAAKKQEPPAPAPAVTPPKPKKKGRLGGLGSVFSRKKNDRETDLTVLVSSSSPDARAPEFASTLAKILTFGAPGRFPEVVALPGGMPMDEFDLEPAKQMLIDARTSAGLEMPESAEIFANVVNCMLIDIVDLASASIKEGEEKVTIDAINIVVDFMQHAASLYDAVAEGIVISPVTYGGDLGKSKLEKMFATYSGSAMTDMENMKDDFDGRVRLLQDVFQISDKKAEGLMMKAMQKQMIEMLKSGEGMEGMQEMMGGMGGMGGAGMPGMPGMDALMGGAAGAGGEEPSPEQVKEMLLALKEMKDSGSFSKDELDTIKKEFKNSFGSSIDDLTKDGQELDETEQELLDLMKSILD